MVVEHKFGQLANPHRFASPLPSRLVLEFFNMKAEIVRLKDKVAELEGGSSGEGEIVIKELSREEAKEEIKQLFHSDRTLYYSDIVKELGLDLEMVVDICDELQKSKEIAIDASVS